MLPESVQLETENRRSKNVSKSQKPINKNYFKKNVFWEKIQNNTFNLFEFMSPMTARCWCVHYATGKDRQHWERRIQLEWRLPSRCHGADAALTAGTSLISRIPVMRGENRYMPLANRQSSNAPFIRSFWLPSTPPRQLFPFFLIWHELKCINRQKERVMLLVSFLLVSRPSHLTRLCAFMVLTFSTTLSTLSL